MFSFFLLATLFSCACATGDDDSFGKKLTTESSKTKDNTQYSFNYFVKDDKTGDYKSQEERRDGDSVLGSYTLADPNGDLRTVTYKASPGTGFEAKVNIQPTGSPMMKPNTEPTSPKRVNETQTPPDLQSNVTRFPGGFRMDVSSKPQSEVKTEMGMKFSMKTENVTEPITVSESKPTEQSETDPVTEPYSTEDVSISGTETDTVPPSEGRDISEDPIEKEIDEVLNSMPKLPELVLSDNKTRFKFHKDPEEALLDERITQIARQLAETSLRREYEERKLGHFIPISLSSVEPSTTSYLSKSFKFRNDPSESPAVHVLTQLQMVPQYVYRQTFLPSVNNRLPVLRKPTQKPERQTREPVTDPPEILKVSTVREKNFSTGYKTTGEQFASATPIHVPTFFQFFTPYVMRVPEKKSEHVMGNTPLYNDTTPYAPVTMATEKNDTKRRL